jgi:hypothetical protein
LARRTDNSKQLPDKSTISGYCTACKATRPDESTSLGVHLHLEATTATKAEKILGAMAILAANEYDGNRRSEVAEQRANHGDELPVKETVFGHCASRQV